MGEQNNTTSYMMIQGSDGEWQKIEWTDIPDLLMENYGNTISTDGEWYGGVKYHLTPTELEGCFTATLKYPKQMRCKSRKRYVKLLMSRGYSRNVANLIIDVYKIGCQHYNFPFSYQTQWNRDYWTMHNPSEWDFRRKKGVTIGE